MTSHKKRLDFNIVKQIFENAYLPYHCTVEVKYIYRKKRVLFQVFDEYGDVRLYGKPSFSEFCSTKFGTGFPSILYQSRDSLVESGVKLSPWKSPFEEHSYNSDTGLHYAVLTEE